MAAAGQGEPALAGSGRVAGLEQADLDRVRVTGVDGKVHPVRGQGGPERGRQISGGAHDIKVRQWLR
jgi:hypothetical protein